MGNLSISGQDLDAATGRFKLGVVWSGLALGVGWFVMRSRQLAIYSGHG